jgi:hypothetical protein
MPALRPALVLATTLATCAAASALRAQQSLDALGERLNFSSASGAFTARLSVMGDLTVYGADRPPPDMLFSDDQVFVAPGVSLFLDAQAGTRLSFHAQVRADRGFDPGSKPDGSVRADEYFVQWQALPETLDVRAGKFATVFGTWPARKLAWDNPLVTAPMMHDDVAPVRDNAAPVNLAAFLARQDGPDLKHNWVPVVWGPSYATGVALLGKAGAADLAVELKNRPVSARPETWDDFDTAPTVSARAGLKPSPEWSFGVSYSDGAYLREAARPTLPADAHLDDFQQEVWGIDAAYAHHAWQLWGELAHASFDVPKVGRVSLVSGYVEARRKLGSAYWVATRLNGAWFGDAPGTNTPWDRDAWRIDLGLGWRYSEHIEAKLQYSYGDRKGQDANGHNLLALQAVIWF